MRLEDLQGRRLGRYEIVVLLGRGGMAAVYRAHDTALRRDVALKVLYPQYSGDTTLIDRFQREAILAASLDHPNIVPIYDVGEADGMVYIAMKLLGGRSLADVLRQRPSLPLAEVVPIVEQIAAALDYAHARQIVHRDIKAGNIMLEDDPLGLDPGPRAVLTDFGIAKSLGASALTGTGVLIGTPDYMAPEQIRSGQTVDYRADIYALGVLVFRCLTGKLPFEGGTEQVLMGHLYGELTDPSMIEHSLPAAVDPVVRRAMARDPAQRYERASVFARALRAAAGQEAPTPPPARRRDLEGRAVIPRVAADDMMYGHPRPDEPTQRGDATPRRSNAEVTTRWNPAGPPPRPGTPATSPRRRGLGPLVVALLLVLLAGGGLLLAQTFLRRDDGGTIGGVPTPTAGATNAPALPTAAAPPTEPPAPTAAPPTEPPAPTTAPPTEPPTPTQALPTDVVITKVVPPAITPRPVSTNTAPPAPTNTQPPANTPSPTPCPAPLTGGFGMLWEENQAVSRQIGCPLAAEQGGTDTITEQPYEHGSMFYYQPLDRIYVLIGRDSGEWRLFEKKELVALPTPTPATPPPCQGHLQGGFELIWSSFPTISKLLGCATEPEVALFEGAYQPFANGTMLYSQKGLGRGKTIYVLYSNATGENGTFERYDDPNQ